MRTLSAALLLLVCTTTFAGTPLPDAPHVVASGQGKVSVKPDTARVQFDFEQRAAQPLPAKQGVDAAVNRLLDSLDTYSVADDDITASSLDASEDVDYDDEGKRTSNGFVASRSVTVLLKDVDRLNAFLDNGLASGAHGIGRSRSNPAVRTRYARRRGRRRLPTHAPRPWKWPTHSARGWDPCTASAASIRVSRTSTAPPHWTGSK